MFCWSFGTFVFGLLLRFAGFWLEITRKDYWLKCSILPVAQASKLCSSVSCVVPLPKKGESQWPCRKLWVAFLSIEQPVLLWCFFAFLAILALRYITENCNTENATRRPAQAQEVSESLAKTQQPSYRLGKGLQKRGYSYESKAELEREPWRWTPHPVIVSIGDNRDYLRVLLYSYYTTITGWGRSS